MTLLETSVPHSGVSGPSMPDVGVVSMVPEAWGGDWMPRHHVLTRLSRRFHVVWVDPALGWRDCWLEPDPAQKEDTGGQTDAGQYAALTIYRPSKYLPEVHRPRILGSYLARTRVRRAVEILRRKGCKKIVLYLWRPEFEYALKAVEHDLSCYHIDDEYSFSQIEQQLDPQEEKLIRGAGQVIIHSPALMEKKGHLNPRTIFVPNGVAYQVFSRPAEEPEDLKAIPHPRIGYAGMIKKQLNLDLLYQLAQRHSAWSFVLVGPLGMLKGEMHNIEALSRLPNVTFVGGKRWDELPAYMQHMDVCIMCYKVDDYTKYIYPLKLHEYLAAGRPVVAAPIRSLENFGDVIKLASTVDEWSEALRAALDPQEMSPNKITERRRIAKTHDWDELVDKIASAMCRRLGDTYLSRLTRGVNSSVTGSGAVASPGVVARS